MRALDWYKKENNKYIIELKIESLEQLFDKKDPNPFRNKDLDDDVVEYITSSAMEIGKKRIGKIQILANQNLSSIDKNTISKAFEDFFHYRMVIVQKQLRSTLYLGIKSLIVGLLFLSFSIYCTKTIGTLIDDQFISSFLKEGVYLLGWVSMWKPINIFLYEWWPQIDQIKLYNALAQAETSIIFEARNDLSTMTKSSVF